MVSNLFSPFEPSTSIFGLQLNWSSLLLWTIIVPVTFWSMFSRWPRIWSNICLAIHKEFKILLGPFNLGSTLFFFFVSLFGLIVFYNSSGLAPYVFTCTTHLSVTLGLALPIWLACMTYGWINHSRHMFAHLVPLGSPPLLMPIMVLIETTSNIIRPATLAIRLAANTTAGHLILTLMGNLGPYLSFSPLLMLTFSQIFMYILETAVALIQAYVFAVLATLYISETY